MTGYDTANASGNISLRAHNAERIRVDGTTGKVSIGGYEPQSTFDVDGVSQITGHSDVPHLKMLSPNGTYGFRLMANVSDTADYGFSLLSLKSGSVGGYYQYSNSNYGATQHEFYQPGLVLFKHPSGSAAGDIVIDRGDNYWSKFQSSHHWDCYNSSSKYTSGTTGSTCYLNYYSNGAVMLCYVGGVVYYGASVVHSSDGL